MYNHLHNKKKNEYFIDYSPKVATLSEGFGEFQLNNHL